MEKYYTQDGRKQEGPFSKSELKSKGITKNSKIWREGLADWTKAKDLVELDDIFSHSTPPPIGKNKKLNWKGILLKTVILSVVIFAGLEIYGEMKSEDYETYGSKLMTIEEIENSTPTDFLDADGTYKESFWGTKINIDGKVKNLATVADYKDVVVRVTYYSKTKTVIGTDDYTLYEVFPPNSITPFKLKIENHKNTNSIGWTVVSAIPN